MNKFKIIARKALNQLWYPSLFYKGIDPKIFPDEPTNPIRVRAKLHALHSELRQRRIRYNLGSLYTLPHPFATKAYKRFINYNPSNLGSWSDDGSRVYATTRFEYEVIHKMIDLYDGNHDKLGGYISTGGTEGNIFMAWLGRACLEKTLKGSGICLLRTSLTHYSIRKAGALCNIPQYIVPLNKQNWSMDVMGLRSTIRLLHKKGYVGYIVPLTLGYTATGTSDGILAIVKEAQRLEKEMKNIKFFFWIDAAFNGLIAPFLNSDFKPFLSPAIQGIVVDFHKFGLVPYPAGIILYKKTLKKFIEEPIDYLLETDATLLGSRSGIPALSIWIMMHAFGKNTYKKMAEEQRKNKEIFMKQLKKTTLKIEVITDPFNLSLGMIFRDLPHGRLPQWIEAKYSLYPGKTKLAFYPKEERSEVIYKCFFLPHLRKDVIEEFVQDLEHL